ncbi:MAG: hypothetical protein MJ230_03030 [bacterium]|nr:hypothetical protein [bacterium]
MHRWNSMLDGTEIIGLKKLHNTITLVPGCQFELSMEPQATVRELKENIEKIDSVIKPILEEFEITLLTHIQEAIATLLS